MNKLKRLVPRGLVRLYHLGLAVLANLRYGFPSRGLTIIGVTGTDGKTTTCYLLHAILRQSGQPASLITSAGALIRPGEKLAAHTGLHVTTPGPFLIQRLLREAKRSGARLIVLETTSHGLDQHRVWGVNYHIGVITNITEEHLDYHGTYENYLHAKAKLLRRVKYSVLNRDDRSYQVLLPLAGGQVMTYGLDQADITGQSIQISAHGTRFEVPGFGPVETPLIGTFNVYNTLAALTAARMLGIPAEIIQGGLKDATQPPGRLERIEMGQPFTVIVDFAHTANGLEEMLRLLRSVAQQRLIVVFGCAGLRDRYKRQPMGASAGRYADLTVLTAEDPRTEDLEAILDEIAAGVEAEGGKLGQTYFRVADRAEAIRYAVVELAQPGDIVVTTGKAQEGSMAYGTVETPWDEFAVTRAAISERLARDAAAPPG